MHLTYGATAAPSEKAYQTINDSPEAITFSWELTTTPVSVNGYEPTAILTIDSTKTDPTKLATLETGAVVNVPFFVANGDVIRVDTRTNEYLDRV